MISQEPANLAILYSFQVWDLRKNNILYRMPGHTDTPTGFKLSPDGCFLLSNAMDNTGTPPRAVARLKI